VGGAASPARGAVLVPAEVGRLVAVIPTVVVKVTAPQFRNTFPVVTLELCFFVAFAVVTDIRGLIAAVRAVVVTVTLPGALDAPPGLLALELGL